jgi:hypothetical protein
MGLPITKEQTDAFRAECAEALRDGDGYGPFNEERPDGTPLWEFHAANYNPESSHDIYELFQSVNDEYVIEEHGYGKFYVVPKTA